MKKNLKILGLILSIATMAIVLTDTCLADSSSDKDLIQVVNPLKEESLKAGEDYIPMPVDEMKADNEQHTDNSIPSRYMYTLAMLSNKYPGTKDQGMYGTCWAFSSSCMAEFDMIKNSGMPKSTDFSELQLAYFTYHTVTDPLAGTKNDKNSYSFYDDYLTMGGNYYVAMRTYAKWIGAINESYVPYSQTDKVLEKGLNSKYAYQYNTVNIRNAYLMSTDTQREDMKAAIMKNGAIGITYNAAEYYGYDTIDSPYESGKKISTHYCPEPIGANHAVAIVGWDDNFSKENFRDKPSENGAWLVRNSWSKEQSSTEGGAYFWLSYCDKTIGAVAYSMEFDKIGKYNNNYQYDGGYLAGKTNASTVANVFKTKDSYHGETLKAVMLSMTEEEKVGYTIEIYTALKDPLNNPASGKLVSKTTGTTSYAGMYTIDLASPVKLGAKEYFSVVVKLNKKAMDAEYSYNSDKDIYGLSTKVYSEKGQSFSYISGKWKEKTKGNYCIKAFTSNNSSSTHTIRYVLNGGTNSYKNKYYFTSKNKAITLYSPSKKNAYFLGWYTDSKYKHKITKIPANRNKWIKLYARWMSKTGPKLQYAKKSKGQVKLKWDKRSGASSYYIYRKSGSGKWKLVKKVKNNYWTDKSVKKGKTYYYRIRAVCSKGKGSYSKSAKIII